VIRCDPRVRPRQSKHYWQRRYLTESRGVPVAPQTLARFAVSGNGPVYRKFGHRVLYSIRDLDNWAEARLRPPQRSSSQLEGGVNGYFSRLLHASTCAINTRAKNACAPDGRTRVS
jgi:hypothetical protein